MIDPLIDTGLAKQTDNKSGILHACRNLYLKQLSQLLQEGDHLPASALQAFQKGAADFFDAMTSPQRKSSFQDADGLTASRISLVGENDLELEIRLGDFTATLLERNGAELWRVYLRFVTLLEQPNLSTADNPVGPKGIAEGLNALCLELAENHDKSLERIERLENYFAEHLSVLYASLNDFLASQQVEAAQPTLITSPEPVSTSSQSINPAAALQRNLLGPQTVAEGHVSQAGNTAAAALFSQAMLDRLLNRLDELESMPRFTPTVHTQTLGNAPALESLIPGLFTNAPGRPPEAPRALNSNELGIPGGAPEAATIDALALIFEAIFAAEQLPAAIKSILSSLQIPLLKAAMLDGTFFSDNRHPARQLLDKMAQASLGLPADVATSHPLCTSLQSIAGNLRSEFSRDLQVFAHYDLELDTLIAARQQKASELAHAYAPLLAAFEQHNQARWRSRKIIEQSCPPETPVQIRQFLDEHWLRRLQQAWLEGGEQGGEWLGSVKLVEDLVWSAQPKTEVDARKGLAKILPEMLKQLNAGMEKIALPEAERNAFLDVCFALQTSAMRGLNTATPSPANEKKPPHKAEVLFAEISASQLLLKTCSLSDAENGSIPARFGEWLDFDYDGLKLCGLLAASRPDSSTCLLVNPEWPFAVAMQSAALCRQFSQQQARVVSTDSLFNKAAEKALHNTPKKDVLA
jgi:hypothetical protein